MWVKLCICFKQFAVENEELSQHLSAAKHAQRQLTAEVLRAIYNKSTH